MSKDNFQCAGDELIIMFKGHKILIDLTDLPLFARHAWYPVKKHKVWYLIRNGNGRTESFHRSIFVDIPKGLEVDHINGNGLDNRRSNLRLVPHFINQNNQKNRPNDIGSSKYRYVHLCKRDNKWCAMISWNNKTKNLGRFKTEEEAALAADRYIIQNKLDKVLNFL